MIKNTCGSIFLDVTKWSSYTGSFLTLLATSLVYAGTNDMKISTDFAWQFGLGYALFCFVAPWLIYSRYRNRNRRLLLPRQIIWFIGAGGAFSLLGFSGFFFYFGFAPMPMWAHVVGVGAGLTLSIYWGHLVWGDVMTALQKNGLFSRIYVEKDNGIYYFKNKKPLSDRNPVKSFFFYVAMLVAPLVVVLNRVLTPYTGSGHGVFMVLSFFGLPLILAMVGFAVQIYILTIYYPIKLQKQTGKSVLTTDDSF